MLLIGIINVGSAMLVLIVVRTNFIGILKALGTTNWSIRKIFGLTLSTLGAIWLVQEAAAGGYSGRESVAGDLMILLNAASYGLYLVLVKPLTAKYKPVTILFYMFMTGGVVNMLVGIPYLGGVEFGRLSSEAWFGLIFLLVGATILAYLLNAWAMIRVSSVWVGTYIYLQPVLTMLISGIVLSGSITWTRLANAGMILAGVYLTGKKNPK
jgi:drug/metabolite transporter (DMT)-like permease